MTPYKSMYEKNGLELRSKEEFHTFNIQVRIYKHTKRDTKRGNRWNHATITVPKPIVDSLGLKHCDFVQVAIRKLEKPK